MVELVLIAGPMEPARRRELLERMAAASPLSWPARLVYADEAIGFAVVAPAEHPLNPVLAWDEAGRHFALLQGELLIEGGEAAHLLALSQRYGSSFTQRLNGDFAAALWDGEEARLTLLTDHLGMHPLYYHLRGPLLFVGTRLAHLLALPDLHPTLDRRALASFLAVEYPVGEATLVEEVALVPPATRLSWKGGMMRLESYWHPWALSPSPMQERERWLEGLLHVLREAVARQARRLGKHVGLLLSGGMDSRLLLALMAEEEIRPETYTFGLRGSDDVRWGREVARRMGLPHQVAVLHPSHLPRVAEQAVALTDGMTGAIHFHLLWGRQEGGNWPPLLYLGYLGGALFSSYLTPLLWGRYSTMDVRRHLFQRANVVFRREDLERLLTPHWYGSLRDRAWETFRDALARPQGDAAQVALAFDLWQRQRRFIASGHRLLRPWHRLALPFADRELVSYVLRIPPGLLLNRGLMIEALLRIAPELGHIPYTGTRLPLISSLRSVAMRADRQLRWRLRSLGLEVPPLKARPYAEYDRWFAVGGALHRWARSLLLAPDARLHAIFDAGALERWLNGARGDRRTTRQIGVLLSLEMWMRRQPWL